MIKAVAVRDALVMKVRERLLSFVDRIDGYRRTLKLSFAICATIMVASAVLEVGVWKQQQTFNGPFQVGSMAPKIYSVEIGNSVPFWLSLRLDRPLGGSRPYLRLESEGREIGRAAPVELYQGYAYWFGKRQRELSFTLPENMTNGGGLTLRVSYIARVHSSLSDLAGLGTVLILLIVARRFSRRVWTATADRPVRYRTGTKRVMRMLARSLPNVAGIAVAGSLVYFASIIYAILAGDTLPTAALFRLVPDDIPEMIEPYLGVAMLLFASAGAISAWAASLQVVPIELVQHSEIRLMRLCAIWGLPMITSLLVFSLSAGGWSGHVRSFDLNYFSIAGFVPHSDSRAYFIDTFREAIWGGWDVLGSRRPLGAAFREVTVFAAQFSYAATLLVQTCIVAIALYISARGVMRWYGVWAGIAFVAFIYILARPYLGTTMTEGLGLAWTLFSIVFLLDAMRINSLPHALIALAGLTFALATRMGSMFTIPAMAVWVALAFARGTRARFLVFAAACGIVGSVIAVNALLALLYADPGVSTGDNFSEVVCGLSLGTDWSDCDRVYDAQLQQIVGERARAAFLLTESWKNIVRDPAILFSTLFHQLVSYLTGMLEFLFNGYLPSVRVPFGPALAVMLLASRICTERFRAPFAERALWILLFASVCLSASIVMNADGWRNLLVTHALIACFFAAGFASPSTVVIGGAAATWRWQAGAGFLATITILFLIVPTLSHALMIREIGKHPAIGTPPVGEIFVPGGRFISGFVVIADGVPRLPNVPSLHASDFTQMMWLAGMEDDLGPFVQYVIQRLPFTFILAGQLSDTDQSRIYIAPPRVLEKTDVWAWRFKLRAWTPGETPWRTLREVIAVEPLP